MIGSDYAALDKAHRSLLQNIHSRGRLRELYAQRPERDHVVADAAAADEIAACERQWVDARNRADESFIAAALKKPLRERANVFKSRARDALVNAQLEANRAEVAGELKCSVAEDYRIISELLRRKATQFQDLCEQALHDADDGLVEAAQALQNTQDRTRALRNLARQFSVRAEKAPTPEERARLMAHAEQIRADLPPLLC